MRNSKTKLLFICEYQSIYGGNFIPSIVELCSFLSQKHKNLDIALSFPLVAKKRDWISYLLDKNFQLYFYDTESVFKRMSTTKKIVKEFKPSVVYIHFAPRLLTKLILIFSKAKLFIHLHSDFSLGKKKTIGEKIKHQLEGLIKPRTTYLSVSNDFLKQEKHRVIYYVPNCLAVSRIPCEHMNREQTRLIYGFSKDNFVYLLFAWSPEVKGLDIAIKAFKKAYQTNNNIRLLVICSYKDGIEHNKKYLLGKGIDVNDLPIVFTEPNEDVYRFHYASDALICSSRSEGFHCAFLESMSVGKPVISSNIPAVQWSKQYKNSVLFFESEDFEALGDNMLLLSIGKITTTDCSDIIKKDYSIDKWTNIIDGIIFYGKDS